MSIILMIIPALVGIPVVAADLVARAAGSKLIDYDAIDAKNKIRLEELLQKKELTPLQQKELKLIKFTLSVKEQSKNTTNTTVPDIETMSHKRPLRAPEKKAVPEVVIPTQMRNLEYLVRTLQETGIQNVSIAENKVIAEFNNLTVRCIPGEQSYISLHFSGSIKSAEAGEFARMLETQYGKLLQEAVYKKLKQNASSKGLQLEEEHIEEDETIILTYTSK